MQIVSLYHLQEFDKVPDLHQLGDCWFLRQALQPTGCLRCEGNQCYDNINRAYASQADIIILTVPIGETGMKKQQRSNKIDNTAQHGHQ
jgi:hypothetical protein